MMTSLRPRGGRPLPILAGLAFLLSGCGPRPDLAMTIKDSPIDVAYGAQHTPQPAPSRPPAAALSPGAPGFIVPPINPVAIRPVPPLPTAVVSLLPSPTRLPTLAPALGCPSPSQFATPDLAATPLVTVDPASATYPFRRTGSVQTGTAPKQQLTSPVARQITNVTHTLPAQTSVASQAQFDQVQDESDGSRTTTTFNVEQNPVNDNSGSSAEGIYIAAIVTQRGAQTAESFHPVTPGVRIMALPAQPEPGLTAETGTDPLTSETMVINRQTVKKEFINACGHVIEAWQVTVAGTLSNSVTGEGLTVTSTYDIATQYGGIIVFDDTALKGAGNGGVAYDLHSISTINVVPTPGKGQ